MREVDNLPLWLDAAQSNELRQLSSSSHKGINAVAEIVVEDTVPRRDAGVMARDRRGHKVHAKVKPLGRVADSL